VSYTCFAIGFIHSTDIGIGQKRYYGRSAAFQDNELDAIIEAKLADSLNYSI
jgi:hypothetical protein